MSFFANPSTVELRLSRSRSASGADVIFMKDERNPRPPLVETLFEIEGIWRVYLSGYTVSVDKNSPSSWDALLLQILPVLRDHLDPGGDIAEGRPPKHFR